MFVYNFHSRRLSTPNRWIPSLDSFIESLIQEQDKLIQMGALKASKNQALLARDTKNVQAKENHRGKNKKNSNLKPKEKKNPSKGYFDSKKDKNKKCDKAKCSYCKRGFHLDN